jgi:hypothetical protein
MLDVHPAHHAATAWREFFVHIGTIVLGLLIAVGLEQTVEAVHKRHEVRQVEEDIRAENRVALADDATNIRLVDARVAVIEEDLARLNHARQRGGKALEFVESPVPKVLFAPPDSAWLGLRDSGLLPLLSELHAGNYWKLDYRKQRAEAIIVETERLTDRVDALKRLQLPGVPATAAEIQALREAFSDDEQELLHLRTACIAVDADIELDFDDQFISPATVGEAKKRREAELK